MPAAASKSPIFKIVLPIVIVLTLVSFLSRCNSKPKNTPEQDFANRITESVGLICAEEALKALGESDGPVVLIVPGTDDAHFAGSQGEVYERSFKQFSQKNSSLRFLGHFLADQPSLTLELLQAVRDKFSSADLLVSFVGSPRFQGREANEWKQSSPPKMIAVEVFSYPPEAEQLLKQGLVQAVFVRKHTLFPPKKPTDPHEIFNLFYEAHRSP